MADLGAKGLEMFWLELGMEIVVTGEMKPSELKVGRIGAKGQALIVVAPQPVRHAAWPPHEDVANPNAALRSVRNAGLQRIGAARRKPRHFEVLARGSEGFSECHVELNGRLRKAKPIPSDDPKWSTQITKSWLRRDRRKNLAFKAQEDGRMPRYFFETDDDDILESDDEGQILSDDSAARREALAALPDMARDKLPDGDRRTFISAVRDETGALIYEAKMTLVGGWKIPNPSSK